MIKLNFSKLVGLFLIFKPTLLPILFFSITKTSSHETKPSDFLLILLLKTLLFARSMLVTPFEVEMDNDILNVSQKFDKVPRKHNTCTS